MFFFVIVYICVSFGSLRCTMFELYEVEHGKRIVNRIIDVIVNVDFVTCDKECKVRKRCLSINYSPSLRLCELNYVSSSSCAGCIEFDTRFVISDMESWDVNNSVACDPSDCAENEKCSSLQNGTTECSVADCGFPNNSTVQYYLPSSMGIYSKITFQCIRGHRGKGSRNIVCQENGLWSANSYFCEIVDCLEPTFVENAFINVSATVYGSEATVQCENKYASAVDSQQEDSIFCQENGTWEMSNLTCVWAGCNSSDLYVHPPCLDWWTGNETGNYANYRAVAEDGKLSSGPNTGVFCKKSRRWGTLWVTCSDKLVCDDIEPLSPGMFSVSSTELTSLVYCESGPSQLSGKWTVIQKRQAGWQSFDKNWHEYKSGFGFASTNYWLGNDMIHQMTISGDFRVAFVMTDKEGEERYALYETFSVDSESDNYRLTIGGYVAHDNDPGDSMAYQNNNEFSTRDRDNDKSVDGSNCAEKYSGGWWYNECFHANLNGEWGRDDEAMGIIWRDWHGFSYSLTKTLIMIQRKATVY